MVCVPARKTSVAATVRRYSRLVSMPGEPCRRERRLHARDGVVARRAGDDQLREQRIVVGRHLAAALDPAVDPDVRRKRDVGEDARAGLEVLVRILGVEAHLDRVPARRVAIFRERQRLAGGEPHHPLDEIDARDRLGHAVLDLQPRVDLEEIRLAARDVEDELDGARRAVGDRLREADRRGRELRPAGVGEPRRRRLLDDLLVPPLQRAVALAERRDRAAPVAEDLHLDVARRLDVALDEEPARAEVAAAQALDRRERRAEPGVVGTERHADAAAAGRALQHDRVADPRGLGAGMLQVGDDPAARAGAGRPPPPRAARASCFKPKRRICSGVGPMKASPCRSHAAAKSAFSLSRP